MAASSPGKPGVAKKPARGDQALSEGPERIQKLLARAGAGSRREIEGWMESGRLLVNGQPAQPGQKATIDDSFELDGKVLDVSSAAQVRSEERRVGKDRRSGWTARDTRYS